MRVAIYARVSREDVPVKSGRKNQDPENQLRELRAFAKAQRWKVIHEYVDRASAKSGDRPQFKKLFEHAGQRRFDLVLFWALDRFSREGTVETLNYLQTLTKWGVDYRSFREPYFDSTGPFKEAIIGFFAALAKQERIRISERTIEGLKRARAAGKKLGRPVVSVDIAKLRQLQTQGKSLRTIARETQISLSTICRALKEAAA
jgi:DNA invertase Pin-like site-specific DNA recombinase